MSVFYSPRFLRTVLLLDAASCFGCGALQVFFNPAVSPLLGLASGLLMASGIFLLVYAFAAVWIATRDPVPRQLVWLLVFGNLSWAVLCGALLLSGAVQPTALGTGYVILQAVTVILLAELQWFGLRKGGANRLSAA